MNLCGRLLLLAALLLGGTAHAEVAVPPLKQRVTDLTATLDAAQSQALEGKLAAFEQAKGAQIAALLLPTTQPETIEQYGIRVADTWKLGRKGVDDGVLLLIAKDDRKLRIEVGYGLEGVLNDAIAKRIVAETITPHFKRGEFYQGIDAGVDAIIKVIEGEALPPPVRAAATHSFASGTDNFFNLIFFGILILMVGNLLLRGLLGRLPAGMVVGGLVGGLAWLMLLPLALAVIAGLVAFFLSLVSGTRGLSAYPGGWGGGGWGGGSSGGWSGGGGGFGGGGASGDW